MLFSQMGGKKAQPEDSTSDDVDFYSRIGLR